ncbi:MAG TPA: nitrate ABC transporter ATP-binding protein [Pseudomonadales bacterium]|nr:nitrate ABC transporter ATP-binding protein [Pseudomonadales bacterium]HNB84334.1 nitrate ABC transporter ATP-binding protein [Pseudomonadales bacterium]
MSLLNLRNISKSFGAGSQKSEVLKQINLSIDEGEFVAIVGFSGSGKSTLINTIAGLIFPDSGEALVRDEKIRGPGPERGMVFQSYSLMPWLSVYDNVALAVNQVHRSWSKAQRDAHIRKYIALVNLTPATEKRPAELSGGMRQRVAVARALAASPDILLLDEPLSALDALTRGNLQEEILRIWEEEKKTVILITNDVDEGLLMADRVIPLTLGPGATFGPEFVVDLPRPRDRVEMNHNARFKTLRGEITQYLLALGQGKQEQGSRNEIELPPVRPNTSNDFARDLSTLKESPRNLGQARYLEFANLSKIYPTPKGPVAVVKGFDLLMKKGEFVSIIGHSGCGKSTVLSMAAGLNDISEGGIVLDGKEIDGAGPDRAVVFQAPSLFPWMSAFDNVALGVEQVYPHATPNERDDIVEYYLTRVGLANSMHKRASELSGGMKQRVGIARAFALSPKLLLLDEPFGMLDSLTRWELQEVLMEVWSRAQLTAIMITHDVDEAILLGDRVVMMTNGPEARVGKILEVDLPRPRSRRELLSHPRYYELRESLIQFLAECDHARH